MCYRYRYLPEELDRMDVRRFLMLLPFDDVKELAKKGSLSFKSLDDAMAFLNNQD